MKRLIAAAAILAVVFVMGCQDTNKVTELQGQVDKLTQQLTERDSVTIVKLTAEKDSLQKLVVELQAKLPGAKVPAKTGGGNVQTNPPGKPPRQGR